MKVLHVVEYLKLGGIERFLDSISEIDPKKVYVLAYEMEGAEGIALEMLKNGRKVFLMKKSSGHDFKVSSKIINICREFNICHVHSHDFGPMEYLVEAKLRHPDLKLKLFHTQHTLHHFLSVKRYVMAFDIFSLFYKKIACVSKSVKDEILKRTKIAGKNLIVIHNGIKIESNFLLTRSSTEPNMKFRIISVSRISPEKNIECIFLALKLLGPTYEYWHLGTGDSGYKKKLVQLSENLKIKNQVRFLGYSKDVRAYMKQCDIFVSASREEGLPLSVLEAMSLGIVCIISDIPAHKEIATDGLFYFDPNSAESLLKQIIEYRNNIFTSSESEKLKDHTLSLFSIEKMANRYLEIYEGAV